MVVELSRSTADRFICDRCNHIGLSISEAHDDWDEDWELTRRCESCGQSIPPERLEAFPDAQCCVTCQQSSERGEDELQPDYCPRCGTIRIMRQRRGSGLAGYEMYCPECRR
jgi:predicted RNA-binding Zn-ribbon protein involved in translation (DUF1610 family)